MNPDEIAAAARRLAAKMVADQAAELMLSFVGLQGEPTKEKMAQCPVVIVAAGKAKDFLLAKIQQQSTGQIVEIEERP